MVTIQRDPSNVARALLAAIQPSAGALPEKVIMRPQEVVEFSGLLAELIKSDAKAGLAVVVRLDQLLADNRIDIVDGSHLMPGGQEADLINPAIDLLRKTLPADLARQIPQAQAVAK